MAEIRVSHRQIINNLAGLTEYGEGRVAAALVASDADGNARVDHAELLVALRHIALDAGLNLGDRSSVANALQLAFTRLGSPAACASGVPHEQLIASLSDLTTYGKGRAAIALFRADENADLCVSHDELGTAVHDIKVDSALNLGDRNPIASSVELAYTRLAAPTTAGGFSLRSQQQ